METTGGTLLGGRLRYHQPKAGHRTGIEPVLLAACVPARPGERVLEAGTGAGAGVLCLLSRVPGIEATGVELDPTMADLARRNLVENGMAAQVLTADVATAAEHGPFDHLFANPPWHDPAGSQPQDDLRRLARHRATGGLRDWIGALARAAVPRGTISLVLPSIAMAEACAELVAHGWGAVTLCPLWPRVGVGAKLMLLQARQRGTGRLGPGLVLHAQAGGYTAEAENVLRHGAKLVL